MVCEDNQLYTAQEAAKKLGISVKEVMEQIAPVKIEPEVDREHCTVHAVSRYKLDQKKKDAKAKIVDFQVLQEAKDIPKSHYSRPANDAVLLQRNIETYPQKYIIRVKYEDEQVEEYALDTAELAADYLHNENVILYFQSKKRFREAYKNFIDSNDIVGGILAWIQGRHRIPL